MAENLIFYAKIELSSATIYVTNASGGGTRLVDSAPVYFRPVLQIGSFNYEYQSLDVSRELPATVDIELINERDGSAANGWLDQYIGFGADNQVWDNRKVTISYGGDEATAFSAMAVENVYRIKRGTLRHTRQSVSFMCYDIRADHDRPILTNRFADTAQQSAIGQFVPVVIGDFTTGLAPDQGGRLVAYASDVSTRTLTIADHALSATGFKLYHHDASTELVTEIGSGDYTETLDPLGTVVIDNTYGEVVLDVSVVLATITATSETGGPLTLGDTITGDKWGTTAKYVSGTGTLSVYDIDGVFTATEALSGPSGYASTLSSVSYATLTAGETLTGGTSGATAIYRSTNAVGQLICDTYAGTFTDGESITASTGPYTATLDGSTYPIDFSADSFSCNCTGITATAPVTGLGSVVLSQAPDIVSYLLTTYGGAVSTDIDNAGTFKTAWDDSDQADNRRWIGVGLTVMDAIGEIIRENNLELYTDGGLYNMRFFEPNDEIQQDLQNDQYGEDGITAIYDPDAIFTNSITASIAPNWQTGEIGEWLEEDTQSDSTSIAQYGDTVEKATEFKWLYNVSTVSVQLQRRLAVAASSGHHATFVVSESGMDPDSPMWRLTLSSVVRLSDDWQYTNNLAQVRRITKSVRDGRIEVLALVLAQGFPVWRWSSSTTDSDSPMRWSTDDTTLSTAPGFWY